MTGEISVIITSVPSALQVYSELGDYLPISQAIGFAIKKDANDDVKSKLRNAFTVAMNSQAVLDFGRDNFYILSGAYGDEAGKVFDSLESNFAWTFDALGSAKVDPASLGIPKI